MLTMLGGDERSGLFLDLGRAEKVDSPAEE